MSLRLLLLFLMTLPGNVSPGQITLNDQFENGRLDTSYIQGNALVLAPAVNLHLLASGVQGQTPLFAIFDHEGYRLRPYHSMIFRYSNDSVWHHFDTAWKASSVDYYYFRNKGAFNSDSVFIAYWHPYTYSDLQKFITQQKGSPFLLSAGPKSSTPQGRNLIGYQISDTTYADCYKTKVVITARQHPTENTNGHFVEGMTEYLLYGSDSLSNYLRRNYHFYFYPMLNPDGVVMGIGQNSLGQGLNREWADSLQPGGTPEIDSIRPIIWKETGQQVDWSIDLHGNPGSNIPYYWWGFTQTSPVPASQIAEAAKYVLSVAVADSSSPSMTSSFQNYIQGDGVSASLTAANWFRKTFGAIAFTFEPTSEPMGPPGNNRYTIPMYKRAGASLVMGFASVHDSLQAIGGALLIDSGTVKIEVSGGLPPYKYLWNGPISSTNDSLLNPLNGRYKLTVTDSLGCKLHRHFNYTFDDLKLSDRASNLLNYYPNPASSLLNISTTRTAWIKEIRILDSRGNCMVKENMEGAGNQFSISLAGLPCGVYILQFFDGNVRINRRLIIQRDK